MPQHLFNHKTCLIAVLLASAAVQSAAAQIPEPRRIVQPNSAQKSGTPLAPQAPALTALAADLSGDYPIIGANADGTDLWPCVNYDGKNPDCPRIGKPSVHLPGYGIVAGFPAFTWNLQNTPGRGNGVGCDALVNGSGALGIPYKPCAQITTWFEDSTNDFTDDLLWHVRVVQGSNVIYDSGVQDYGPAGPSVVYPVSVALSADANFGYWPGAELGPNNGDCGADVFYPLQSPAFPNHYYQVSKQQSCVEPIAGPAKVYTQTILATPSYTQVTGRACTSKHVPSPCYTVSWATKYEIHQDFDVTLQ